MKVCMKVLIFVYVFRYNLYVSSTYELLHQILSVISLKATYLKTKNNSIIFSNAGNMTLLL